VAKVNYIHACTQVKLKFALSHEEEEEEEDLWDELTVNQLELE